MDGARLPAAVKVIAACNPYRLRKGKGNHDNAATRSVSLA